MPEATSGRCHIRTIDVGAVDGALGKLGPIRVPSRRPPPPGPLPVVARHRCSAGGRHVGSGVGASGAARWRLGGELAAAANLPEVMGSLIKKRRKRMRKKKHKKMLKATRWQRRAAGK